MTGHLRLLATLVFFAVLPVAASAEGVNFTVPNDYLVAAPPAGVQLPAVYRMWDRQLDGVRHSIVVSASPATADLATLLDATLARLADRRAIGVTRTDAEVLCGTPSARVTYAYANQLAYVYRYAVVSGRLLIASYAHPAGTAPDPDALASLDTLCSGIHQPATPKGWTIEAPYPPNANSWRRPDSVSTLLVQAVSPAKPDGNLLGPYKGQGTPVVSRQDACGAIAIRRVTANLDDGRILEYAAGTAYAYDYVVSYVRPASEAADPGALAVLTSFCAGTLPPS